MQSPTYVQDRGDSKVTMSKDWLNRGLIELVIRNNKLLGTSASLLVTNALLLVTRS